jgi:hypothetical protein
MLNRQESNHSVLAAANQRSLSYGAFPLKHRFILALAICLLAACDSQRGQNVADVIPTQASLEDLATALPLTQNAPPPPYNGEVTRFSLIDNGLNELPGWRYLVQLEFDGVFSRTPRETQASAQAEVSFNQLASARRVNFSTSGDLIGQEEDVTYEAVKLGPDSFLVQDNACLSSGSSAAETAAEVSAGSLVGGVNRALPAGGHAVINGEDAYTYNFAPEDLNLPPVRLGDDGSMTVNSAELWISPTSNAVVRFYVNLYVENAVIFNSQLPVTGDLIIRYDAFDFGTPFNITVPFGC